MNRRQKITLLIIGIILVLFVLIGITYAYFVTRINGSITESVNASTLKLELVYGENDPTVKFDDNVLPGYSVSKEFNVTNNGSSVDYFSIKIENVVNTFIRREDLIYIIEREGEEIKRGMLPNTESWLVYKEKIEIDETINYKITVEYLNKNEDQSEDMDKDVSFKVNIDNRIDNIFTNAKEGTLIGAIARDNAISETLTKPGQALPIVKYENKGFEVGTYENGAAERWQNTPGSTTFLYSDDYTFDETNAKYTLIDPKFGSISNLEKKLEGKYVIKASDETASPTASTISQMKYVFLRSDKAYDYYYSNPRVNTRGNEAELSYTEDDYGTSYYFRGDVKNNYINYSGMCWRIVRIQGDGTIKLVLADENNECNSPNYSIKNEKSGLIDGEHQIRYSQENVDTRTDDTSVMYEHSVVKEKIEEWIIEKGLDESKMVETDWCNDTSRDDDYRFGASKRSNTPSLKCDFVAENGTKSIKYKDRIALLTLDELRFAGGGNLPSLYIDTPYYLLDNAGGHDGLGGFWTMSPESRNGGNLRSGNMNRNGSPSSTYVFYTSGIRPAIVLNRKSIYESGDGTQLNPYIVK